VLSITEDIGAAAAAFKVNDYANRDAATIAVFGFSGQLKNWGDNHLTYDERLAMPNHTKLDAQGNSIQDDVEALIHTITLTLLAILRKDKLQPNLS